MELTKIAEQATELMLKENKTCPSWDLFKRVEKTIKDLFKAQGFNLYCKTNHSTIIVETWDTPTIAMFKVKRKAVDVAEENSTWRHHTEYAVVNITLSEDSPCKTTEDIITMIAEIKSAEKQRETEKEKELDDFISTLKEYKIPFEKFTHLSFTYQDLSSEERDKARKELEANNV